MIKDTRHETRIRELEKQLDYLSGVIAKDQLKIKDMQVDIKMLQADVDRLKGLKGRGSNGNRQIH